MGTAHVRKYMSQKVRKSERNELGTHSRRQKEKQEQPNTEAERKHTPESDKGRNQCNRNGEQHQKPFLGNISKISKTYKLLPGLTDKMRGRTCKFTNYRSQKRRQLRKQQFVCVRFFK